MTDRPDIAVIILNWNGWEDTRECLQSLRAVTARCRIVLVDNGSSDGSIERARLEFPEIEIVDNGTNLGFAEGNNRGIRHALSTGADYVMLLNNDTVVDPHFVEPLLAAFERNPGVGFASPTIYYAHEPKAVWFCGGAIDWRTGWAYHRQPDDGVAPREGTTSTPIATGCCLLAPRETWDEVGLLDPRFFLFWEDSDWTLRATRAGRGGVVVAESRIWHKVSRSFTSGMPTLGTFYFVRNGLLFIRTHAARNPLVALRFLDTWALRPTLREARRREGPWLHTALLRASGVAAYITGSFGAAPGFARRLSSTSRD